MTNPTPAPGKVEANNMAGLFQAIHMLAGKVNIAVVEQDAGAATAVATKIIDTAACDGEILAAFYINAEAFAGSTNAGQTWISKESAGTTLMTAKTAEFAVSETVGKNVLGSVMGAAQSGTEADRQFDLGDDVYVYTEAETSRSAGILFTVVLWKERT